MDNYNNTNEGTNRGLIPYPIDSLLVPNKTRNGSDTTPNEVLQHPPIFKESLNIAMIVFFCVAYLTVFVLALVNNSLVLTVIYKNTQMHTVTNYFLANLAAADITVSFIVLPITLLSSILSEWWFGSFLCKAIPYLQAVAVGASVNTLGAVAVERYFAIFRPQDRIITPTRAVITILALWMFPCIIQVPWIVHMDVTTVSNGTCIWTVCYRHFPSEEFEKGFFLGVMFLTCYLIPLCFICVCYSMIGFKVWQRNVTGMRGSQAEKNIQRIKIRIVRMLVTVAVVFASFWIPLYAINIRILFGPALERKSILAILMPLFQWLGSATSAVNPFIYCYFSMQFRKYIFELLPDVCCKRKGTIFCKCNEKHANEKTHTANKTKEEYFALTKEGIKS